MKIKSTLTIVTVLLIFLYSATGCTSNNPLVLEMEDAHKLPSDSWSESNKHVAEMISQHFPKGMKISDALNELIKNEFVIVENKREGTRQWPDGEIKPYAVEEVRRSIQKNYTDKQVNYLATFDYWASPLERREAVIKIQTDGEFIVKAGGAIYSNTL